MHQMLVFPRRSSPWLAASHPRAGLSAIARLPPREVSGVSRSRARGGSGIGGRCIPSVCGTLGWPGRVGSSTWPGGVCWPGVGRLIGRWEGQVGGGWWSGVDSRTFWGRRAAAAPGVEPTRHERARWTSPTELYQIDRVPADGLNGWGRERTYLGWGCRVQTLAQEHRVGVRVAVERFVDQLGEEGFEMRLPRRVLLRDDGHGHDVRSSGGPSEIGVVRGCGDWRGRLGAFRSRDQPADRVSRLRDHA